MKFWANLKEWFELIRSLHKVIPEPELTKALAGQFGMEYQEHIDEQIDPSVIALLTPKLAHRYQVVPLSRETIDSRIRVKVAIRDPMDVDAVDELRRITNLEIEPVVVPKPEIQRALQRFYGG